MHKLLLYFNTLKYLRLRQYIYRLKKLLVRPKVTDIFERKFPKRSENWMHIQLYQEKIDQNLHSSFLNHKKKLNFPDDWNNESLNKLWLYNLHYFEDLLSEGSEKKHKNHLKLLKIWIEQNTEGIGNGWEPYPTSLRIVNTLKAWLGGLSLDMNIFKSIFYQSSFLSNNLEKHLLGNHYFVNLKALFFAGVIFKKQNWINKYENLLIKEIDEQVLDDGANFELSPMYHSLMLVDLLDLLNLCRAYPKFTSSEIKQKLETNISKMLIFYEAMLHPDGGLSFFNDSVDGIAPTKDKIYMYALKLGFAPLDKSTDEVKIFNFKNSGYMCASSLESKLIFDACKIGPDYIPGHGHADTLSFELSLGRERVFVNSGISEYGLSQKRISQRKTCSHNTVEVDNKDSSQVWSGFRVANRANIVNRQISYKNNIISMSATHDGYKTLFGGCFHFRELNLYKDKLFIKDLLKGRFDNARSFFYFHPKLHVSIENNHLIIRGRNFAMHSDINNKNIVLKDSLWHPEFGMDIPNKKIEVSFDGNSSELEFKWERL